MSDIRLSSGAATPTRYVRISWDGHFRYGCAVLTSAGEAWHSRCRYTFDSHSDYGRTCVADVSPDIAGTFVCDPFRIVPIYLLAEAGGGAGRPVRAGFAGAADIVVRRLEVELADGSRRAVEMNAAGGFEYRTTDRAAFPVRLFAYGTGDRILLRTPLPTAAPPRTS